MQKKTLHLHLESGNSSIINSLEEVIDSYAPLQKVELKLNKFKNGSINDISSDNNTLNVYLINTDDSLHKLHENTIRHQELYSYCEINSRIHPALHLLRKEKWDKNLLDFYMIGGQRQFFEQEDYNYLNDKYYDLLHVGNIKDEITEIEPYLRDSHLLRMSFNALRKSDFSAKEDFNPCGFEAEDFVRVSRYAGLSPRLNTIIFQNIDISTLKDSKPSQELLMQMLWYMSEGYGYRQKEDPDASANERFVFDLEDPEMQVNFIQSAKSGRWWYRFEDSEGVQHTFSCNFTDFESLQNKTVSARIKSAILRYL